MEPSPFRKIRTVFAALLAAAATGAAIPAYASAFTVTSATSGQTTTFTVTRSGDTSVAETVAYRAVSRSALAGLHFRETAGRMVGGHEQWTADVLRQMGRQRPEAFLRAACEGGAVEKKDVQRVVHVWLFGRK